MKLIPAGWVSTFVIYSATRTSFGCAHILQHQQQKTTEHHGIETIGHIAVLCRFVNAVVPIVCHRQ